MNILSQNANMLLTSTGPATEVMQERLHELGESRRMASELSILRVVDGWVPFAPDATVARRERVTQRILGTGMQPYSNMYLRRILGRPTAITNILAGEMDPEAFDAQLDNADMLVVPGGNTFLTIGALATYADSVRAHVSNGLPYVSESAGTILTGETVGPALLPVPDPNPDRTVFSADTPGLSLVPADVITHAAGREVPLSRNPLVAYAANLIMRPLESSRAAIDEYHEQHPNRAMVILQDDQALSIRDGEVERI